MEIRSLTRKLETSQEAERIALEGGSQVFLIESLCNYVSRSHFKFWVLYIPHFLDAGKLKGIIDSLQGVLSKRCDQEGITIIIIIM